MESCGEEPAGLGSTGAGSFVFKDKTQPLPVAPRGALARFDIGEQGSRMILRCLASRFAAGPHTLYVHGLRRSNVRSPGKFLVFPVKCETSFFVASEEHLLSV